MRLKRHFKHKQRTCILSLAHHQSFLCLRTPTPSQSAAITRFDIDQYVQLFPFKEPREQDGQADQEVDGRAFQVEDAAEARHLDAREV